MQIIGTESERALHGEKKWKETKRQKKKSLMEWDERDVYVLSLW